MEVKDVSLPQQLQRAMAAEAEAARDARAKVGRSRDETGLPNDGVAYTVVAVVRILLIIELLH